MKETKISTSLTWEQVAAMHVDSDPRVKYVHQPRRPAYTIWLEPPKRKRRKRS